MPLVKSQIIFIVGPTAVGKSEVTAELAKKIKAEIISCDSMQIYKGMDIITSKPSDATQKKAAHHLISVIPPTKEYNVSQYRKDVLKKIKNILRRKKTPIFVGGTGLYMTILVDGIFEQNTQDELIRGKLHKIAQKKRKHVPAQGISKS